MKDRVEVGNVARSRVRYLLALVFATLLAFGVAVPVFAQEEPANEDGGTVQPQIVGGEPVENGKYPFVAALLDVTRGDTGYEQQFCGGTLLDQDSVLTAAHCLEGATTPVQLRVAVGRTELNSDQGETRGVAAISRHPRYTSSTVSYRYDAAVLTLDRPITGIEPVVIPSTGANAAERPGTTATVAGWGNTARQPSPGPDRFPNRMQEARVPLVSDARAKRVYDSSYAKPLMVAAGKEGKDTCQGDSGGPMFKRLDGGDARQIGITSFGNGCARRGFPGVYAETNAPEIRSFIYEAAGL